MDTKTEIYKKALEIFTKRGYDNTPMSHIAKALGVSKAALYHHFPSKEGLLYFIIDRMTEERFMPIVAEAEKTSDPKKRLNYFVRNYARLLTEDASAKIIIHEDSNLKTSRRSRKFIEEPSIS
jgi:TetR/AcrR family transcriptional regulator, cholesterol catabolism regulator